MIDKPNKMGLLRECELQRPIFPNDDQKLTMMYCLESTDRYAIKHAKDKGTTVDAA